MNRRALDRDAARKHAEKTADQASAEHFTWPKRSRAQGVTVHHSTTMSVVGEAPTSDLTAGSHGMSEQAAFERILASLYDAMLDDRHWPATSALIDEACGITGNALMVGEGSNDDIRAASSGSTPTGSAVKMGASAINCWRPVPNPPTCYSLGRHLSASALSSTRPAQ